uniref:Uncharacterized protein n=1 Tax=Arundo donax TaxID=35708 RepID=A0A0A9EQQ4_ARUDO
MFACVSLPYVCMCQFATLVYRCHYYYFKTIILANLLFFHIQTYYWRIYAV